MDNERRAGARAGTVGTVVLCVLLVTGSVTGAAFAMRLSEWGAAVNLAAIPGTSPEQTGSAGNVGRRVRQALRCRCAG